MAFYLAYLLALSWEGPRLDPAVLTKLGGSQVEGQRCSLSSEGPGGVGYRARSVGALCTVHYGTLGTQEV